VIALLLSLSLLSVGIILFKLWHFWALGVGRHASFERAMQARDAGDLRAAREVLAASRNHLAPVLSQALEATAETRPRLVALTEARLAAMQSGLRLLDSIAQIAPLLGLFGTVLGMIEAFRALQEAGAAVDPSLLAGGIWVALLTTAAGLAVAMPTALALSYFDTRADRERARIDLALETLLHPMTPAGAAPSRTPTPRSEAAHVA